MYIARSEGCRCTVTAMTASQLKRYGIEPGEDGKLTKIKPDKEAPQKPQQDKDEVRPAVDAGNSEAMQTAISVTVPDGWDYNPGKDVWLPEPKNYPGWAKEKVETVVAMAKEQSQTVSYVGRVDYADKGKVLEAVKKQEDKIVNQEFESAVVVTKSGDIFRVAGSKAGVKPEILGSSLAGAPVTHNHPASETQNTFSSLDLELFSEYDLEFLRGIDDNFIYELIKDGIIVDDADLLDSAKIKILLENPDFVEHLGVVRKALTSGFGYRRYKK